MTSFYTWAFDGVGGAAVVAIGVIVYERHFSRHSKTNGIASTPANDPGLTEPTPEQILKEVASSLPFDRDSAKQKYIGLNVVWKASLLSLNKSDDKWLVVTRFGKGATITIVGFSLSSVPNELSSATQYSTLLIKGTIRAVGGYTMGVDLEPDPEVQIIKRA